MSTADEERLDRQLAGTFWRDVHVVARQAIARDIRRNPEKHMEALEAAGLVERMHPLSGYVYRVVVPPHECQWRVDHVETWEHDDEDDEDVVILKCKHPKCSEFKTRPNAVPLEVPNA